MDWGVLWGGVCVNLDGFYIEMRDGGFFGIAFWDFLYTMWCLFQAGGWHGITGSRERDFSHLLLLAIMHVAIFSIVLCFLFLGTWVVRDSKVFL